jgi:phosphatidylglycerol---prolipoprotein diacylglyceryl transferase
VFEAIEIGPFIIWTYSLFLMLGIWLSTEFFLRLAQSAGLSLQHFRDSAKWHLLAFLLGGRLIAMLMEYRVYLKDPLRSVVFWDGGFSFLGGAIGIAAVLYFTRGKSRTTFLQWLDVLLPAASFGLFFEWLGKFASGKAYGSPTDVPWGVTYDAINVRFAVPIHPVQLYYAAFFLMLTFLLLIVRKNAKRAGAETLFGIVIASFVTFALESFRGDLDVKTVPATLPDLLLLLFLFVGLGVFSALDVKMSQRAAIAYCTVGTALLCAYILGRLWLPFDPLELRFSQFLSILSLLASVVYVVVHRRRYPHL